jgi:quercetin dioxygenase-like cupin family protein
VDTNHTSVFDWTIPAGFATGLHAHRVQEETFFVLEGECEWWIGAKAIRATPGTFLFIPPGTPHNITNVGDKPARVLMTVSPPGHEGYFVELAKLPANGAPDPTALAALRDRLDTDQLTRFIQRSARFCALRPTLGSCCALLPAAGRASSPRFAARVVFDGVCG